ncbi:hypothetical protein HanRHA438_Chr15g0710271 [Helianthus annuus]|nr:hypothetical protein HanRHA438_Chr15g0710271 [Helianthus annuus]
MTLINYSNLVQYFFVFTLYKYSNMVLLLNYGRLASHSTSHKRHMLHYLPCCIE